MAVSNENVAEEVQNQEVVPPTQDHNPPVSTPAEASSQEVEESSKEYNFKQLREVNRQLEDRASELEESLESFKRSHLESSQSQADAEIGEEDLVEGKHLNLAIAKIEEKIRQKELEAIPDKLKSKFADFDQVVSKENLDKLKETEPELYRTIRNGTDLFAKGVAAYKTLKSLGISPEEKEYMKHKDQAQSNHQKPMSAQAIKGAGALHEANVFANGLTDELKKQLRKEMSEAAKAR